MIFLQLQLISWSMTPHLLNWEKQVILRNCLAGNKSLMNNNFVDYPIYNNRKFEQQFCMSKNLFERIFHDLQEHHQFWILRVVSFTVWLSWLQIEANVFLLFRIAVGRLDYCHIRRWPLWFINSQTIVVQIPQTSMSGLEKQLPSELWSTLSRTSFRFMGVNIFGPLMKLKLRSFSRNTRTKGFPGV